MDVDFLYNEYISCIEMPDNVFPGDNMLNKSSEVISKCRHRNKYMLVCYDNKDWMASRSVM